MKGKLIHLLVIIHLVTGTSLMAQSDLTVELVDAFSKLEIQSNGETHSIALFSDQFTNTLKLDQTKLTEFGLINPTHLILQICLTPEQTSSLKLFKISNSLRSTLHLNGYQPLSYNDIAPIRNIVGSAQNEHPFSSHVFTPAQNFELRNLNKKISNYENIANIFQLASPDQNLTQKITTLLSSFPTEREAYQNQLDGLPNNSTLAEGFSNQLEQLKNAKPSNSIIPNQSNGLTTLEGALINNSDGRLFPQLPMLFVQMFDSYRDGDLTTTLDTITRIIKLRNSTTSLPHQPNSIVPFMSWSMLLITLMGLSISMILAITALNGSQKAIILSLIILSTAWILHYLWMVILPYPIQTFFQSPQFIATTGLFIPIFIWLRRKEWIIAFIFISIIVVLYQHLTPIETDSTTLFWQYAPAKLKVGYILYLSVSTLATVTAAIMGISTAVIGWKQRATTHDRQSARTLTANILPLIHLLNILNLTAILLKSTEAFISVSLNPIWNPHFFNHIAMVSICALTLQLRWINKLTTLSLFRMTSLLLFLGIAQLINLPDSLALYLPLGDQSNNHTISKLILLAGMIGVIISYTPDLIRLSKSLQPSHRKKTTPPS